MNEVAMASVDIPAAPATQERNPDQSVPCPALLWTWTIVQAILHRLRHWYRVHVVRRVALPMALSVSVRWALSVSGRETLAGLAVDGLLVALQHGMDCQLAV